MEHLRLSDPYLGGACSQIFWWFLQPWRLWTLFLPELNTDLSLTFSVSLGKQKVRKMDKAKADKGKNEATRI
ncbi:hypothetical protein RND71_005522 [Anisodus tanguticus]|uniref:Uncharacterized protein n=1 Tax=Anisodus tanguticus TaxID=243964 RepID=A0AAE1VVJ9_9SOLA|nr:hypothetical protein RND71_005522 [Anisodus tanguticus]